MKEPQIVVGVLDKNGEQFAVYIIKGADERLARYAAYWDAYSPEVYGEPYNDTAIERHTVVITPVVLRRIEDTETFEQVEA